MQKFLTEAIRILIAIGVVAGGVSIFRLMGAPPAPPERDLTVALQLVETVGVHRRNDDVTIDVDGIAVPFRDISVAAEVAGRITERAPKVRTGKFVAEGELLMQIDSRDYAFDVARLRSEITQAENSLKELDVERQNADKLLGLANRDLVLQAKELKRVQDLMQRKAASIADEDMAKRSLIQAENSVAQIENQKLSIESRRERLKAGVKLKQVQLERAELDLKRTTVVAPLSGVIVEAPAEEDAYVQRGTRLLTIEDTSRIEVSCRLQLEDLYWLWRLTNQRASASRELPGSPLQQLDYEIPKAKAKVFISIDDRQKFYWDAELSRAEGIGFDDKTRTMQCRLVVENPRNAMPVVPKHVKDKKSWLAARAHVPPPALIRGMFVDVHIIVPYTDPLLGIPDDAIRPGGKVWVYEPGADDVSEGKLREVHVDVIQYTEDELALVRPTEVLHAGAQVVRTPLIAARDGLPVRRATTSEKEEQPPMRNAKADSDVDAKEDPA